MRASDTPHPIRRDASQEISLTRQVENAEREIQGRAALVSARVSLLGDTVSHTLRQSLTSPGTLLWAAGFGFFAGELSRPKTVKRPADADHDDEENAPGMLATLLKYVAIARSLAPTLSALWQHFMPQPGETRPGPDEHQTDQIPDTEVETDPPSPAPTHVQSQVRT
jgi:hypothetical protein